MARYTPFTTPVIDCEPAALRPGGDRPSSPGSPTAAAAGRGPRRRCSRVGPNIADRRGRPATGAAEKGRTPRHRTQGGRGIRHLHPRRAGAGHHRSRRTAARQRFRPVAVGGTADRVTLSSCAPNSAACCRGFGDAPLGDVRGGCPRLSYPTEETAAFHRCGAAPGPIRPRRDRCT